MKAKKLVLIKKTVATLNGSDLITARGGGRTYYSCALSDLCPTDDFCTNNMCECTFLCTRTCILPPQ
jgi:hypothetical protein